MLFRSSGPPLTEEQRRRIAAMENLLDHDLDEVRARRDEADLAARKREEAQKKKEQERLERLKASQKFREQQEAHAKENAKLREEREKEKEKEQKNTRTTAGGARSHGTSKVRKNAVDRSFNSNVIELSFLRIILAVIVILAQLLSMLRYIQHVRRQKWRFFLVAAWGSHLCGIFD